MARIEDIKVRLSVIDEVSPVLRRLRFGFWLASHPTATLVVGFALSAMVGLFAGATLVLWAVR